MTRDESFRQVAPILARALQRIRPDIAGGVDVPVPAGPPPLAAEAPPCASAMGKRSSVDTARGARVRPVSVHRGDPGVTPLTGADANPSGRSQELHNSGHPSP